MSLVTIVCSNCGHTKQLPVTALPQRPVRATCPKCQHVFRFEPTLDAADDVSPLSARLPGGPKAGGSIDLTKGLTVKTNKLLFSLFLLAVLGTVGVRLWADARYRAIPYPNLLALSPEGLAVASGETIYVYAHDGTLLHSYSLPAEVKPSQLFWDGAVLCLADMQSKTVRTFTPSGQGVVSLSGERVSAQFKVAREPATGDLFVSDGAKHRILVFDQDGRFKRSFGQPGKNPGELRFPNELLFETTGHLLIANTKRGTVDRYSPDGHFQQAVLQSEDRRFRYPTDLALTGNRVLALECDGALENGIVRVYDHAGRKLGEVEPSAVKIVGDVVADGERLYLSDCLGRQLLVYSLVDFRSVGVFSQDFAQRAAGWQEEAKRFDALSTYALIVLAVLCVPVIFLYWRIKHVEARELARIEIGSRAGRDAQVVNAAELFLVPPVNLLQFKISLGLFGAGTIALPVTMYLVRLGGTSAVSLAVLLVAVLGFTIGLLILFRSGGLNYWRSKQTAALYWQLIRDGMLTLLPDEVVERVALAQHKESAQELTLLLFTNKRLLLYFLRWNKVAKIEQCSYEAIAEVLPPVARMLTVMQSMQVKLIAGGEERTLKYFHPKVDFLELLSAEFSQRRGRASSASWATLCLTCRQPLQGDFCSICATTLAPDWRAMWLSLLFPGLGQLKNGELQKGLIYIILTVVCLMCSYLGIKGWFFEGADLNLKQKYDVVILTFMTPFWYVSNVVDAYRSSIRGRKPH